MNKKIDWNDVLEVASISDVGMRRSNNQDAFAVNLAGDVSTWKQTGHMFIVADGMGAHAAGELASGLAVEKIPHLYRKLTEIIPPEASRKAVKEANAEINRRGEANEEFHQMGTTCSMLTLLPQGSVITHVGDSRVYRLRGKRFEQMTFDHSLVWEIREANRKAGKREEVPESIPKNVITRSLGPFPDVKVDLEGPFDVQLGDTYLLCSDGLTNQVTDNEIGAITACVSPDEAVKILVDLSNLRGGPDNITVVIIRVKGEEVTTQHCRAKPFVIGKKKAEDEIPILVWVFLATFLLVTIVMWFIAPLISVVSGILTAGLIGFVIYKLFGNQDQKEVSGGRRFGKGPYTRCDSTPNKGIVAGIETVVNDLKKAAVEEQWNVDLSGFEKSIKDAEAAAKAGNFKTALCSYSRGMTSLMDQIRGD